MGSSYQLLKDCTPPEPLSGGNEYKLCTVGYWLNLQHAHAQSKEMEADMHDAPDSPERQAQFEQLKAAVAARHETMQTQFSHVKDCFVCSVAFGLTPAPRIKQDRKPFGQILGRLIRGMRFSKMKAALHRI